MKASLGDLEFERWLRLRNAGEIEWVTKEGNHIPIKDLDDNHLINIIHMLEKQGMIEDAHWEALGSVGDVDFNF